MLNDRVVVDGSLSGDQNGYSFDIRIPWYRALPLSCFEELRVRVDGTDVEPERVHVEVNGVRRQMDDMPPRHDEWWYVTDAARVDVDAPGGLAAGGHELDVTVGFRIPYLVTDGKALVMRERCHKHETLEVPA